MGWLAAWQATVETLKAVFDWKTGGRTKDENTSRDEAEHWKEAYDQAMASGDVQHAVFALDQLRRVRDQARAKRT